MVELQAANGSWPVGPLLVTDLLLDAENPRLSGRGEGRSQDDLLAELFRRQAIGEIIDSLAQSGYFDEEPLIAVPHDPAHPEAAPWIVVEGNRRLAALTLLLFPNRREAIRARNIPAISAELRARLEAVPVKVYRRREDVIPYLGVRHIAGVRPWDALAKARYVRQLHSGGDYTLAQIAQRVGAGRRTDVVRRWLMTLYAIDQAHGAMEKQWDFQDSADFSWLYTSMGYKAVREFVGIEEEVWTEPRVDPAPPDRVEFLILHMEDLYGSSDGEKAPKVGESRAISDLAQVYASPAALGELRRGATLARAYRKTLTTPEHVKVLLEEAQYQLSEAAGLAPLVDHDDEAAAIADACVKLAEAIVRDLRP